MLNNETFLRDFCTLCKSSLFYGTTTLGILRHHQRQHQCSSGQSQCDRQTCKKKEEEKGILLSSSSFSFFIISYKIFLEQRSDNNFFVRPSTKKGNESLVFSWNQKKGKKGKNLTDTLEMGVYDGHFPVNAFLPSCPDILPPLKASAEEEATLVKTGLHP